MKRLLLYIFLLFTTPLFSQSPYINNVNPLSGPAGTTVTIWGRYFNTVAANNNVFFGGVKATVISSTSTSITTIVPIGATYKPISVLNTTLGLTGYSPIPFITTSDSKSSITSSDFDPKVDLTTGYSPREVCMSDIDGDGKLDMVVLNTLINFTVSIFRNTATKNVVNKTSFSPKVDIPTGNTPIAVAVQDMDGDGKPELIVANKLGNTVSVYPNKATSGTINVDSFGSKIDFATAAGPLTLSVGDIDGDGKPDIVTANGATVSVLLNNSVKGVLDNASFAAPYNISVPLKNITLADLDSDSRLDIAGINTYGMVSVIHNASTYTGPLNASSFETPINFPCGNGASVIATADLNNDYKLELVTVDRTDNTLSILTNATNGAIIDSESFLPRISTITGKGPYQIAFDDIDGDGLLDMAVPNYNDGSVSVIKNIYTSGPITSSSFAPKLDINIEQNTSAVALADIDGDGRKDIIVTNNFNTVSLLRKNPNNPPVIGSITPLAGPVGTTVTINGSNFNKNALDYNIVHFGAAKAKVISATANQIVVQVPPGSTYKPISVLNTETTRSAYSLKPFNVTYTASTSTSTSDFESPLNTHYRGQKLMNLELSDIDGDGNPDMVTADITAKKISVWRSKGLKVTSLTEQFYAAIDFEGGDAIENFKIGDLDGDGKPDIITINETINTVSVLRNISTSGNIAFEKRTNITSYYHTFGNRLILVDLNTDGKLDIVTSQSYGLSLYVHRNVSSVGKIAFAASTELNLPTLSAFAAGDIDGDGKPDLVISSYDRDYPYKNGITVIRNTSANGKFSFEPPVLMSEHSGEFDLADINEDGKLDIILHQLIILKNTSTAGVINGSSFAGPLVLNSNQARAYTLTVADIDGDGKPDLLTADEKQHNHSTLSIFKNNTNTNNIAFNVSAHIEIPYQAHTLAVADIDGDNLPDILAAMSNNSIQPVYHHPMPLVQTSPQITGVSPLTGAVGSQITITGNNFNILPSGNTVTIGNISKVVTTPSPNSLTLTVPASSTYSQILVANNANKRISNSWLPFNTTYNSKYSITENDFNAPAYIRSENYNQRAVIADIDGDGKLDLVVISNQDTHRIFIHRNISIPGAPISAGSFAPPASFDVGRNVKIIDVDGDGKPDILAEGGGPFEFGNSFGVRKNTSVPGTFSFNLPVFTGVSYGNQPSTVADVDGDGLADMISTDADFKAVKISQNISRDVQFTFGVEKQFPIKSYATDLSVADFNNDGKPDIVTNNSDGSISILKNTSVSNIIGTTSFAPHIDINTGNTLTGISQKMGDIDGDGKLDIIISYLLDSTFSILRNTSVNADISFAPKVDFKLSQLLEVIINDIDGDGKPDILASRGNNYTTPTGFSIFRNTSTPGVFNSNSLSASEDIITGSISSLATGDLDGDGKSDILASMGYVLSIYQNNPHTPSKPTISTFAPKSALTGTVVTIKGTDFNGTTAVSFGGVPATSFKVVSPTIITAVPANGNSGSVSIQTPLGSVSLGGFIYGSPTPEGTSITPLADTIKVTLIDGKAKTLTLSDLATINSTITNPKITLSTPSFNCSSIGNQNVSIKIEDSASPLNPAAVKFDRPSSVAFDVYGNLYICDAGNSKIRKISASGEVTTLAGSGSSTNTDGKGTLAGLAISNYSKLAVDPFGNIYFTAGSVRKLDTQNNVTTLAGNGRYTSGHTYPGSDIASALSVATGIAAAPDGTLYVSDMSGGTISKVTPTGVSTVFAGYYGHGSQDGQGYYAAFSSPGGVAIDDNGIVYVADSGNGSIRKITPSGQVSTLLTKKSDTYLYPLGITVDQDGDIYIISGSSIVKITPDGTVTTIAGSRASGGAYIDGPGSIARFNNPSGIAVDGKKNVYVADLGNNCIRKIDATGFVTTFAGGEKGYRDGHLGAISSSATALVNIKVTSDMEITNTFTDQHLALDETGTAEIPDYTKNVLLTSNCESTNFKISQLPGKGTRLNATEQATVTISATDPAGYSVSKSFKVTADVNRAIVLNPISSVVYGAADIEPQIIPPTNSTVTLNSSNTAVAIIVENRIRIVGAGIATITATSAGAYIDQKMRQLIVTPARLTIKAQDKTILSGSELPIFTYTTSGFVNSDTEESITIKPTAETSATNTSISGTYPILFKGASSTNYTFSYLPGVITILKSLPVSNFVISTTTATCRGLNNGSISITAAQELNYMATLTGTTKNTVQFDNATTFKNLAAGTYKLCIRVAANDSYEQCYTLTISEPKTLGISTLSTDNKNIRFSLEGGTIYNIQLNGISQTTRDSIINLELADGKNDIIITTDKPCQGVIYKTVISSSDITIYPTPFENIIYINLGYQTVGNVRVDVYSTVGFCIYASKFNHPGDTLKLDLSSISIPGVYMLKLTTDNTQRIFKIIKK
ncbi:FG-GAP-like repeat-containing protein [Desertivirga xinjiangensis]|uniref:FG-GAP-like repeat-containing protein n=1 Tax=Desertivirga xinjiangensis TaxID=539206 RepID=UPI00210EE640|nr:FG-GAP-like repeat-containing protein [Pedobacter xinjiangensis]